MKICFLIGHRDAPEEIRPALEEAIERHITECGVTCFLVGNYGHFDRMAQSALVRAKELHPGILLYMAIPYHPAIQSVAAPEDFDGTYFPERQEAVPRRAAIPRLNQMLVQQSDYLIVYARYISEGTHKVMEYAQRRAQKGLLQITRL